MIRCSRFLVRGRVQGVWYRASAEAQANALGIRGWVRNLPGGEVEVHACGEEAAMDALRAWLWQGPKHARVSDVHETVSDEPPPVGFVILGD